MLVNNGILSYRRNQRKVFEIHSDEIFLRYKVKAIIICFANWRILEQKLLKNNSRRKKREKVDCLGFRLKCLAFTQTSRFPLFLCSGTPNNDSFSYCERR